MGKQVIQCAGCGKTKTTSYGNYPAGWTCTSRADGIGGSVVHCDKCSGPCERPSCVALRKQIETLSDPKNDRLITASQLQHILRGEKTQMIKWTIKPEENDRYTLTFSAEGRDRITITTLRQRDLEKLSYAIGVAIPPPF